MERGTVRIVEPLGRRDGLGSGSRDCVWLVGNPVVVAELGFLEGESSLGVLQGSARGLETAVEEAGRIGIDKSA